MTIAEQLRAEGEKKGLLEGEKRGLTKGRLEGERELLRKLLSRRFGDLPSWVDQALENAGGETLDDWTMRVLDAPTLDAIFLESH